MNCPFCQFKMKFGYINSKYDIVWTPQQKSVDEDFSKDKDAIFLTEESRFNEDNKPAYYCQECERVVIK